MTMCLKNTKFLYLLEFMPGNKFVNESTSPVHWSSPMIVDSQSNIMQLAQSCHFLVASGGMQPSVLHFLGDALTNQTAQLAGLNHTYKIKQAKHLIISQHKSESDLSLYS